MRRLFVVAPLLALVSVPAVAGDPDFNAIVRDVESGYGVHRVSIPLFGLARFAVKVARPEGVQDFDMAIFETPDGPPPNSSRFDAIMARADGGHWSSVIRVRSGRGREWTCIYVRPEGRNWRMLIATFQPAETVILHARVNPEVLARAFDDPEHAGGSLGGGEREQ
jgi:hypothetical protein